MRPAVRSATSIRAPRTRPSRPWGRTKMMPMRRIRLMAVENSEDTYPATTASTTPRARPPASEPYTEPSPPRLTAMSPSFV